MLLHLNKSINLLPQSYLQGIVNPVSARIYMRARARAH
jgi:hypothetical protein